MTSGSVNFVFNRLEYVRIYNNFIQIYTYNTVTVIRSRLQLVDGPNQNSYGIG